jgi:small subunit ribosomal protein S10
MASPSESTSKKAEPLKVKSTRSAVANRVRIKLQSYDHRLVDISAEKIVDVAKNSKAQVVGPIPLPTRRQVFCVLRSPHVNKSSREHFQFLTHKRLIDIHNPGPEFAGLLSKLDLPAGVDIQVRL